MSLLLSINTDDKVKIDDPDYLIKCGIDTIYKSFNANIENYIQQIKEQKKAINNLSKKLELMNEEIEMIQRENQYYKTQNEKLKNEVENLNKIIINIKSKLTKFDFKINNKKIIDNINQESLYNNSIINNSQQKTDVIFKKDFCNINNNFNKDKVIRNIEFNKNSNPIKYDLKNFKINKDINESDINNFDNNINVEQEINIDNFQKNSYNEINEFLNNNLNEDKEQILHNNYKIRNNDKNNDYNIDSLFKNNILNIRLRNNNRNYNNENIRLKRYTNKSFDISSALNKKNKNNSNINFNNNKNKVFFQKKLIMKNKVRSNSSNNVALKKIYNNEIKNLTNRNNENSFPLLKEELFVKDINISEYNSNICKTYQNQKKLQNINMKDKLNRKNSLKDLKTKEMTLFLKKCKVYLDKTTFDKIVKVFQDFKYGNISDEVIVQKLNLYLRNNNELLILFKNIIS